MPISAQESLIDDIYEAAVVPDRWKSVLEQIALRVDAAGTGLFFVSDTSSPSAVWSDGIHDICSGWIEGGWQSKTQRAPRMQALNHAGFVTDSDIYQPGEMERDEAFAGFLKPARFGYGAGTGIVMPTGEVAVYSFERRFEIGPFTRADCISLDPFRPHLARAALLSSRAGLERANVMASAFETIGLPGAVVRRNGRLLAANASFQELIPSFIQDRSDRLYLVSSKADGLLASALEGLASKGNYAGVQSVPVAAGQHFPPMILHLIPVRGTANDFFLDAFVIVLITPVDSASIPEANVLQGLFDLTPTEAKVAQYIGATKTIDDIAVTLGTKRETVRTQLKAVLAKTGTSRQIELTSLLAGKAFLSKQ